MKKQHSRAIDQLRRNQNISHAAMALSILAGVILFCFAVVVMGAIGGLQ